MKRVRIDTLLSERGIFPSRSQAAASVMAGVIGLIMAMLWLTRWPTRRQSIFFAMTGSASIVIGWKWW